MSRSPGTEVTVRLILIALLFWASAGASGSAHAESWGFPVSLDDRNTVVSFEVDSTWHRIHGRTSGVHGRLEFEQPGNPRSVHGEVIVPVNGMETGSTGRDKKMREVMDAANFTDVRFAVSGAEVHCDLSTGDGVRQCPVRIVGTLFIRGVSRPWMLPGQLVSEGDRFVLNAEGTLRWPEFNIEDPSILVARLDPEVKVIVQSQWKRE